LQREAHAGGILLPNSQRGERFLITSRIPHTSALRRMACSYRFGYSETSEGRSNIQNAMRDESPRWLSPLLKRAAYAEGAPTPCSIKGNRLEVRSRTRPPVRNLFSGSFGGLLHNLLTQWIAQCGWLFRPRRRGASSYRFAFVCKKMCRKMETVALTTCRARLDVAPHESGLVH